MENQQSSRKRGRHGGFSNTFVGGKMTDMMTSGMSRSPQIMADPRYSVPVTNYMNRNKERGTPSSAVRTTAPKLYV
jgi:hypothetical protein